MMRTLLKCTLLLLLIAAAGVYLDSQRPEFGRTPTGKRLERIRQSPHYYKGRFWALNPIEKPVETSQFQATMRFLFGGTPERLTPAEPMLSRKTDLHSLDPKRNTVVWMGHSTFYLQLDGTRILIDPVFSGWASPLPFINKAFAGSNVYKAEDIPDIDVLVISHDHWDHLDYPTLMALKPKIKKVVVPLGIGEHFEYWGFDMDKVTEEDWYTAVNLSDRLTVHILPAQHFTGRFLNQNQSEACAFAFITPEHKVFYSGDGGYTKEFREYGQTFGGFDLAILENGQYNQDWPKIHMNPKETAQAGEDLKAKAVLPCHGGKFALARHPWDEPFIKLASESTGKPYKLLTPRIGEAAPIGEGTETFGRWWEEMKQASP